MTDMGIDERAPLLFLSQEICAVHDLCVRILLSLIYELVPGTAVRYSKMYLMEGKSQSWWQPSSISSSELDDTWDCMMGQHPVLQEVLHTHDGRAKAISELWTEKQFHRSALYRRFYKPIGVEDALCVTLEVSRQFVIGICIYRNERSFTKRDRILLNFIGKYLALGYQARSSKNVTSDHLSVSEIHDRPKDWLKSIQEYSTTINSFGLEKLTSRELEILAWMAEGKSNSLIAETLGIKASTVKKHAEHIFPKLGVEQRLAAVRTLLDVIARVHFLDTSNYGWLEILKQCAERAATQADS